MPRPQLVIVAAIEAEEDRPVSEMGPEPIRPPGAGLGPGSEMATIPRKWTRRRKSSRVAKLNKTKRGR